MASQNGIWLYSSRERQGTYRLILIPSVDGRFHAQRHRFNADGSSLPLQIGDVFTGDTKVAAIEWLNQHHLQLTLRGWKQIVSAGIAKDIKLCSDTARRQEAKRLRTLRKASSVRRTALANAAASA